MSRSLRIAMLSHSTNPRGGVVHAMQLSEALTALGHEVVLHAPDAKGVGFFRRPACGAVCIPVEPTPSDMTAMVEQRIDDYVRHFENPAAREFDIFHAHDGISGNAVATLKERGLISAFARTVHHIDQFSDLRLMELQDRSIDGADLFFTVSALWQRTLKEKRGIASTIVGNGVDTNRFSPATNAADFKRKLALPEGPVFLAVGGIEARKNTLGMLEAFRQVRAIRPNAQFVIAGGASLLDHRGYQGEFRSTLALLGDHAAAVHILGTIADEDMPALYRLADTLVFASVKEGFGLVVLEAMASGIPTVVSSIAPFTEYLSADDTVWCDPTHPSSIAEAMAISLMPPVRDRLISRGLAIAALHSWQRTAAAHLSAYETLKEPAHA
ncbi:MSMEG_0565 family glycosyltransferase [Rhizobium sp. RCC_161_2]|uniref:MSMEG_0565 family glycosyltransferase n=1 Tax=Rhizobium sp. RCC_161_2 TaxID=3239219 RepID=UPI003523E282